VTKSVPGARLTPAGVGPWANLTNTRIRHRVFFGVFALSQLLWFVPGAADGPPWGPWINAIPAATVLVASVLSVVHDRNGDPRAIGGVVPALDLVAAGVLRDLTGGSQSAFTPLILVAVVLAGMELRQWVAVAVGPIVLIVYLQPVLINAAATTTGQWFRTIFATSALWMVALLLNAQVRQLRNRLAEVERLRHQEASFLELRKEQAEELRSMVDAITEQSIIVTDLDGQVVLFNRGAEKLLRYAAGDVVGKKHITDFHLRSELLAATGQPVTTSASATADSRDHVAATPDQLEALVAEARLGKPFLHEWRKIRANGTTVPAFVSVTPRNGPDGQPIGFLFVATDLAWSRQNAALKNAFVTVITHELRTPLSNILGYLELLAEDLDPVTPEQANHLTVVERNANRLLQLVSDLLFIAQVESGRFVPSHSPVDFAAVVLDRVRATEAVAASRAITLTLAEPPSSIVLGDRDRLAQAVDNLLSNAVKFTRPGGQVTVTVAIDQSVTGPLVRLTVADTGVGISSDELDLLFTRFFRATTATRNEAPGVGMGMTIIKAIAAAHDGFVSVSSRVGHGSTFTLTLPLQTQEAHQAQEQHPVLLPG
jgi:signal transduction histidine kinase